MGEVLLDLLLLLVVSRVFWKFVGSAFTSVQKKRREPPRPPAASSVHMERDPVCGTFVVPDRAVALSVGREQIYFCSPACRDQYRAKTA